MPRKPRPRKPKKGRTIPLSDEALDVLKRQKEAFRKKFGRDPGPGDPVFFDPDADTPQKMDPDDMMTEVIVAMRMAGLPPDFEYAYRKTGLLGIAEDKSNWPKEHIEEWEAAVAEYLQKHEKVKHFVRLCRPRFDVTVLKIDAEDDNEASLIALERAENVPDSAWHLQAFDPESYHPHVEECESVHNIEANVEDEAAQMASYIERLRSPEATEYTRYMLLKADINGGDGDVIFEPWFCAHDPGLLEADIAGDWIAELKSTVEEG